MKTIKFFFIAVAFITLNMSAQQKVDTIKVGKDIRVNLFFPSNINNVLKGSKYLLFNYDKQQVTNFGSVTIAPGKTSNLTIITKDKYVYSFIIKYDDKVTQLNYFLKIKDAVNKLTVSNLPNSNLEKGKENKSISNVHVEKKQTEASSSGTSLYDTDKDAYYKRISLHLTSNKIAFRRKYVTNNDITLRLRDIAYNNDELYFVLSIKNETSITYDVNFVKFYLSTIKKKKKSGLQDLELEPRFIYHSIDKIKAHEEKIFVYVIKKLTINKNKKLVIEVNEKSGERNLRLDINNNYLNNATNINE